MTADIVAAYVVRNSVPTSSMPELIASIADALVKLDGFRGENGSTARQATQDVIRRSITHEALISFEDGKPYKTLKRHLTAFGLTPETYRAKWGLPPKYPMVAPGYSETRSAIATRLQRRYGNNSTARPSGAS
ncbi:MucR family transcriptional regulator [Methylobacterium sp. NPDC080182]|uniref:MucR family transcriptional regulator n=1 Tax=Methylobacterium sp. NPDC080182 TaxID=3390590 RepID=UPI003D05B45F